MNKKLELRNKKVVYYLKVIIIVSALAFALTIASALFNKKSDYTPGNTKALDDTGYTDYSSGWPNHFYRYRTFMSIGKPVVTDGKMDWNNFVTDMFFFYIPASLMFIISTNLLSIYRRKRAK